MSILVLFTWVTGDPVTYTASTTTSMVSPGAYDGLVVVTRITNGSLAAAGSAKPMIISEITTATLA
jgi:hypothetical protein